jgi:superfamily II DNA or RNA helicase
MEDGMEFPDGLHLWPHQEAAVSTIEAYLNRRRTAAAVRRAALINVPTGGGKTAIIGVSAHWHPRAERVLVLAPRTAIRDQLARELGGLRGFFPRHGFNAAALPRTVKRVSTANDLAALPERGILISTIQLIDDLTRSPAKRAVYDDLADWCDAIFVDEGHYEPARSWSQTIRGLNTPTMLVTATPYRNDLKLFELDAEALHVTRYEELVAANILREVAVIEADPAALATQEAFVQSVYNIFVEQFGAPPSAHRKLIIRCDGEETVRQIGNVVRHHAL